MSRRIKHGDKTRAIAALLFVGAVYAYIVHVVPNFRELFQGFGAELPIVTRIFLESYRYWSILFIVIAAVGCALVLTKGDSRGWYFLAAALTSTIIFGLLLIWAMYAPIFALGAVS